MTAKEEGHIDPSFVRLLREATEDIEIHHCPLPRMLMLSEMQPSSSFNMRRNSLLLLNGPVSPTQWENEKLHLAHYEKQRGSSVKQSEEHKRLLRGGSKQKKQSGTAEELLTGQSGATIDNLRQIIRDAKKQLDEKHRRRRLN